MAEIDSNAMTIKVDFQAIQAFAPSVTDAGNAGGVLVIVLYHEYLHLSGSYSADDCGEIQIQRATAAQNCGLVYHILDFLPTADVSKLCALYSAVAESFNDGKQIPGGASTVWATSGCPTGGYPGDIPPCPACN